MRGQKFKQQYLDRFCKELNYKFVEVSPVDACLVVFPLRIEWSACPQYLLQYVYTPYISITCQVERTNNRGDGVACFVSPRVQLVDSR